MTATARRVGLPPVAATSAAEQLQRDQPTASSIRPLPAGQGGRATGAQVGIADASPITFLGVGDTGGVADPSRQKNVASVMAAVTPRPAFFYHLGDIDYYQGEASQIGPQFYEPYAHLSTPIVAIPGNHDGDALPGDTSLSTFLANFCAPKAVLPAGNDEYGRDVQTQPWCDWTLQLAAVTIVGLYTNVPSGGHLEPVQTGWLAAELKAAPADRPLVIALHHPSYSVDAHHGGSTAMGSALDGAFQASGRVPDLVLSGHVHNYQRFTRPYFGAANGTITYVVAGNGGYHNLHSFAPDARPGLALPGGVTFEAGDDKRWGFVALTVTPAAIAGEYVAVDSAGSVSRGADRFQINQ